MADMRVKVGGRDLTEIASDDVPDLSKPESMTLAAYAVHRAVLQRAAVDKNPQPAEHDGIPGWHWRGWVNPIIEDIWAWMANNDDQAVKHAKRDLNRYLRTSGNLICITQGNRSVPSLWWVRGEFSEVKPTLKPAEPPATTVKVTAAEAGEDRVPEPVQYKLICTYPVDGGICGQEMESSRWRSRHVFLVHRSAEDWITKALEALGSATGQQLHDYIVADSYPASYQNTMHYLQNMVDGNLIYHWSGLYHLGPAPAAEVKAPAVSSAEEECTCREPECGKPFSHFYLRSRHEDAAHPYSSYRDWPCPFCPRKLYSGDKAAAEPMRLHLTKSHALTFGTEAYEAALSAAEALHTEAAAKHATRVKPAPTPVPAPTTPVVEVVEAAERITPDQVADYLSGILAENRRLREQNGRLATEIQQLTARLRRQREE